MHCNPITHFDALGLSETAANDEAVQVYDAALMASEAYSDDEHAKLTNSELRERGYIWVEDYQDNDGKGNIGFSASLYAQRNTGELIIAFRGTEPVNAVKFAKDMNQNIKNGAFGANSEQYEMAIKITEHVRDTYAKGDVSKMTLVGHSLGGGLASTAAVTLGVDAITFNAAGMNHEYAKKSSHNANDLVNAYYVKGEILNHLQQQNLITSGFMPNAVGVQHELPSTIQLARNIPIWKGDDVKRVKQRVDLHLMPSVLKSLEKAGYNKQ